MPYSVMDSPIDLARTKLDEWKRLAREGHPGQKEPLVQAEAVIDSSLASDRVTTEQAHLGYEIYAWHHGKNEKSLKLMRRYLAQDLTDEERAWAWWNKVDMMACMSYGRGIDGVSATVTEHRAFYDWAKKTLPPDRLLWVIQDGTQAVCWREAGFAAEWFERFDFALSRAPVCDDNRWDRFIALRTAATVARVLRDASKSAQYIDAIRGLIKEDHGYPKNLDLGVEALILDILDASDQGDSDRVSRLAIEALPMLSEAKSDDPARRQELSWACGNIAAAFLQAKSYAESIAFGRKSIELAPYNEHVFLRLAAAVWATGGPRAEVLSLIKKGAPYYHSGTYDIRDYPEFADVAADSEFLEAQLT